MTSHISAGIRRRPYLVWLVPVLWTVALGLWGLSRQNSVWRDEAATWQVAARSPGEIWHLLGNVDAVHGLYYLLMHVLFEVFGASTTTLRLPSVLAVAVAAGCVALIGRRLAGPWAGLGGGLALALLPAVQFQLQEGRSYALIAGGAGLSTLLLISVVPLVPLVSPVSRTSAAGAGPGRRTWPRWTAYGALVLVCALLNWFSLLILPAHAVTLWWARAGRAVVAPWLLASGAAVAGALPLILFSRTQSGQVSWIPPLTWHMMIGPGVLLAVGALGAWADLRGGPRTGPTTGPTTGLPPRLTAASVGLPLLAVPLLGLAAASLIQPLFLDRYVLFSMLGLALLIGAALGAAVRALAPRYPRASGALVPAVVAVSAVGLLPVALADRSPASRVDDVLAVAGEVSALKRDGDAVLFVPAARRDTALVSPGAFAGLTDLALVRSPAESGTLKGEEASPARISAALREQRRVLLVTDSGKKARPSGSAADRAKAAVLRAEFTVVEDRQVRGRRVTVYERRG
ncbi:glycosyltransferase family 39 protein [Streptomyces sp. NBC_01264]|uniref:glycosyltransferase family 39 protein n=1 Tax=Streptomyces sp. NBC_01264 TaxID=2903804 RepID=UPI0022595DA6|nr:glycosyltransferase family 39 protein [Streptomyces sp. NBC_01264]MCX4776449.1 glycosyltransferase family 39 protein [Streptomyces sp. NBC_01264]